MPEISVSPEAAKELMQGTWVIVSVLVFYGLGRWTGYAEGTSKTFLRMAPKSGTRGRFVKGEKE